ncbi:zinc metalloproteinase-disintegrin-like VLAIP-A isoform X2 [Aquarana catesbeiana]|uniref:zinc metalloproteinase-disintegrin-like VLAIP-A isoform X2 n=1 Tax=Aquarana catesbeiana TaxID=8400 RepID=UPI003CCA43B9
MKHGLILTKGRRYLIEPQNLTEGMHVVYEEEENPKACAVTDEHWEGSVLAQEVLPTQTQEEIDRLLNAKKFIELVMVADTSMYHKYGNNTKAVKDKVFAMVNLMNADYKILNISVVLVGLEIWDTKNQIEVNATAGATLDKFSKWRQEKLLPRIAHDNAQLITNTDFEGPTVGLGNVGSMCSEAYSAGIDQDHNRSPAPVASTLVHEVGHNLGMQHDDSNCSCSTESCIMSPFLSSPPASKFSQCSMNQFKKYLLNLSFKCLMNKPKIGRFISPPFCGNNLIENGEQCDCGAEQECTNPCCDASTCKLKAEAVCADGECCEKCQFKKAGSMCQHSLHECDLPDTCDGKSNRCLDLFKKDGTSCMDGKGYCLRGKCPTLKNQCIDLWGSDALVGADHCFVLNFKGLIYGHCTLSGDRYLPCSPQDMNCGVLFCSGGNDSPNINADTARAKAGACKAVLHPSGMVQNGAKCEEEKVCYKGACTSKEAVYESLACNAECPGQVTCNQAGQCYCQEEKPNPKCAISGV